MTLTVGSLCSGAGGMDLGLQRAGMTIAWHAENDPYASCVLARHWPDTPNLGDITRVDWSTVPHVDVIAAGYPCPSFSQAARGRNVAPNLWPHVRDAIDAVRPRYVILENVAAHLGRGFDRVLADLDAVGFDAEWTTLTACAFGASHMRRRLFVVAYPHRDGEPVLPVNAEVAGLSSVPGRGGRWGHPSPSDVGADDGTAHRLDRLRLTGNAVVPACAEWVGRRVMEMAA